MRREPIRDKGTRRVPQRQNAHVKVTTLCNRNQVNVYVFFFFFWVVVTVVVVNLRFWVCLSSSSYFGPNPNKETVDPNQNSSRTRKSGDNEVFQSDFGSCVPSTQM